ncbi:MAG: hypothetical protein ACKO7Z_05730 [Cyanobacteriota bacterium]
MAGCDAAGSDGEPVNLTNELVRQRPRDAEGRPWMAWIRTCLIGVMAIGILVAGLVR